MAASPEVWRSPMHAVMASTYRQHRGPSSPSMVSGDGIVVECSPPYNQPSDDLRVEEVGPPDLAGRCRLVPELVRSLRRDWLCRRLIGRPAGEHVGDELRDLRRAGRSIFRRLGPPLRNRSHHRYNLPGTIPSLASVCRTSSSECSTRRMISSFPIPLVRPSETMLFLQ
jgi:hypothetical protein